MIKVLNLSQSISALTFSSFLLLHLTAPIMASFAPRNKAESLASGFMVLGRVYYQEKLENIIVWGSLTVHVFSGGLNRVLKVYERKLRRLEKRERIRQDLLKYDNSNDVAETKMASGFNQDAIIDIDHERPDAVEEEMEPEELRLIDPEIEIRESTASPLPSSVPFFEVYTLHHITGYALLPFALHHSWLHRLLPATSAPPYNSLSPTLISYALVGYSLSTHSYIITALSALSYGAILSLGSFHALSGVRRLIDPTAPIGLKGRRTQEVGAPLREKWKLSWVLLMGCAGVGLARLALEGHTVPKWLGKKYDVLLRNGFLLPDLIIAV